jgi:hypothetical protein
MIVDIKHVSKYGGYMAEDVTRKVADDFIAGLKGEVTVPLRKPLRYFGRGFGHD